jgi:LytS/YehU family sensor histidine kinase
LLTQFNKWWSSIGELREKGVLEEKLKTLMENSIKHGSAENGEVRMEIIGYMDGNMVKVEIKDEGRGMPEEVRRGVYTNGTGLRNVNERLNKIYGDDYGLELKENKPNGTIAVVAIPKVAQRR